MERYVLVPDSFKGTLASREICEILREEILTAEAGVEALGFGDVFSLLVRLFFCGSVSTP